MHVCVSVNPEQFLPRLKALAPLVGSHFPSPILQSVQLKISQDGRGVLRATNRDAAAEVEVPLLKVIRPGAVQLPTFSVLRALADATTRSKVEIHGLLPDTLPFMADPNVPSRKVVVRTRETSVTLPTWDPDDFPALTPVELTEIVEIAAWKFRRLLTPTPSRALCRRPPPPLAIRTRPADRYSEGVPSSSKTTRHPVSPRRAADASPLRLTTLRAPRSSHRRPERSPMSPRFWCRPSRARRSRRLPRSST